MQIPRRQWKNITKQTALLVLTNAVRWFQRVVDNIIKNKKCQDAFAYLDW